MTNISASNNERRRSIVPPRTANLRGGVARTARERVGADRRCVNLRRRRGGWRRRRRRGERDRDGTAALAGRVPLRSVPGVEVDELLQARTVHAVKFHL